MLAIINRIMLLMKRDIALSLTTKGLYYVIIGES